MREILFKAKRVDNGEWVKGDLQQDRDLETVYISGYDYYSSDEGVQREEFVCMVVSETVCQYTGLTDINGNRIWENDIVRDKFNNIYVVDYCNEWGAFRLNLKVGLNEEGERVRFLAGSRDFIGSDWRNHLIIGNIFDNPELLEVWK